MDKTTIEESTIEFLRATGSPCPRCGHSLKGLSKPVCPECGRKIRVSVDRIGPLSWFIGMAGLLLCIGISLDQVGLFAVPVLLYSQRPLPWEFIVPELVCLVVLLAASVVWWRVRFRASFWSRRVKIISVVAGIVLPVLYFGVLLSIALWNR